MKFFITDESNITSDDKFEFFVYGGLVVDESEIRVLCKKLISLKKGLGIKIERPIKWSNINWNKEGVLDSRVYATLKKEILGWVNRSSCKILIYLTPHNFYHDLSFVGLKIKSKIDPVKQLRTQEWAINASLHKFNSYLESINERGIVLADNFNSAFKGHMSKHCFSLFPDGGDRKLDQIIYPLLEVDNEYSHLHQINDVVLGAITYSMREMNENFLPIIKDNFWMSQKEDYTSIINKGINIYPKRIQTQQLRDKIDKVKDKFRRLMSIV